MSEREMWPPEDSAKDPLYALPKDIPIEEDGEADSIPFSSNALGILKREKYKLGAGVALSGPFLVGLAQGLSPRDAIVYGVLQIATIGSATSPNTELVRHMMHEFTTHNTAAAMKDFREVQDDILESYKSLLKDAGVFGIFGKIMYDRLHQSTTRKEAVVSGIAPIKPKGEQVVILGGKQSFIADSLISGTDRQGFFPVFETPLGAQEVLLHNRKRVNNNEAVYLSLGITERTGLSYLKTPAWERLKLTRDNLIHADNGKRYLLVVGCGEKADEELSLNPNNVDVTQDDLRSAALRLKGLLKKGDLVEDRDVIDVYVGNAALERVSIENQQVVSDRDLAHSTGVDIYIDTWAHVLRRVAEKVSEGGPREVTLATTTPRYKELFHRNFADHLRSFPLCEDLAFSHIDNASEDSMWLVYEDTSEETFMAARRLRKLYPDKRIIALLSSDKTARYADHSEPQNIEFISASSIIADAVRLVRDDLKSGNTPEEIQNYLDSYAPPVRKFHDNDNGKSKEAIDDSLVCIFDSNELISTIASEAQV